MTPIDWAIIAVLAVAVGAIKVKHAGQTAERAMRRFTRAEDA